MINNTEEFSMKNHAKHMGIIAVIMCIAALLLAGCQTVKATDYMRLGDNDFEQGNYDFAIWSYKRLLEEYPKSPLAEEAKAKIAEAEKRKNASLIAQQAQTQQTNVPAKAADKTENNIPAAGAFAQQGDPESDFQVTKSGNGITITKYVGNKTTVTIPPKIQNLPVTRIGDNAFESCFYLTSITIPNSVTSIGKGTFESCFYLTNVTIPNSVTSIGDSAFSGCHSFTSITIPNSVTSIGEQAFAFCEGITKVTIPSSVTSIVGSSFNWCKSLTAINVDTGNTVYSSQDGILYNKNKTSLIRYPESKTGTSFTIPNSVTSIGNDAFSRSSLTSITIPNGVTSIGDSAFWQCKKIASITIPNSVISIGMGAFCDTSLTDITIPDSVISIGEGAFTRCKSIAAVNVASGNRAYSSDNGVLYNKNKTALIQYPAGKTGTSFTIPKSVTSIGKGTFESCFYLINVTIPNGVTSIGDSAFSDCSSLTSITIPNSVTSIGDNAFADCTNLTSVTIPSSVTSIGNYAFSWAGLTSITISDGVTSIGEMAFFCCIRLINITIPTSVTSIGEGAFSSRCESLTAVNVASDNIAYSSDNGVLYNKNKTSLIKYPARKTGTSFTIPKSVTSIEYGAFDYCIKLTSITIPDSVTSIGKLAFSACTSLTSVTFQGAIPSTGLDSDAFGYSFMNDYIGDLRDKYLAGGPGRYTRANGESKTWSKQ